MRIIFSQKNSLIIGHNQDVPFKIEHPTSYIEKTNGFIEVAPNTSIVLGPQKTTPNLVCYDTKKVCQFLSQKLNATILFHATGKEIKIEFDNASVITPLSQGDEITVCYTDENIKYTTIITILSIWY